MENESKNKRDASLSHEAPTRDDATLLAWLIGYLGCLASELVCEYEGERLISLHIRCAISIDHLPPEIAGFRFLRTLRLSGQWKLSTLPASLGQLKHLEILEFVGCRLTSIPPEIGQLANLQMLRLEDTSRLSELPPEIGHLTRLSTLALAGNQLRRLPSTFAQLANLQTLDLSSNVFFEVPEALVHLHNLRHLDLSYNFLKQLPAELGQLRLLETLRLAHNHLEWLPRELGQLARLESLLLDGNRLTGLPQELGQLTRLLRLSLENNRCQTLPEELTHLLRLEHLSLERNQLSTLPSALIDLPYLHPLVLDGNPLDQLDPELLTRLTTLAGFPVEAYRDATGTILTPKHIQYQELWLEEQLFYAIDASQNSHRPSKPVHPPATPLEIDLNQVLFQSSRQHHYIWIRLEFWDDEPPMPAGTWDLSSDPTKSFHFTAGVPDSGTLYFCDQWGEKLSRHHFQVGEANKYYSIRILCRGREEARQATWNDGHPPRGHEQYLIQFWPYRPKPQSGYTFSFSSLTMQSSQPPDPSPLPEDGYLLARMAERLKLDMSNVRRVYRDEHLVELYLRGNHTVATQEFPPELLGFTHLRSLSLGEWQRAALWPEIGRLTTLETLYLGNNGLTSLPPEIGQLVNLKTLYLSENHLTTLPPEIGRLSALRTLEVRKNRLSSLPPEIGQLSNLSELNLDSNQVASLPSEIGQLDNLSRLSLDSNRLTSLPLTIGLLTNLKRLSLNRNPLQSLPPEIGQLINLTELTLSHSFTLAYLPPEIGSLRRLHHLQLSYNNLQYLPRQIGRLRRLDGLDLLGNWLQSLPRQVGQLPSLAYLSLASNRLVALPEEIEQLPSLKSLILDETLQRDLSERLRAISQSFFGKAAAHSVFFETGPYYDSSGNLQTPRHMACHEITVDYSQFSLVDEHEYLGCQEKKRHDGWMDIFNHAIFFISAAQYHHAWVRGEAWEHEPPPLPSAWDITSEIIIAPHSGSLHIAELMGGWTSSLPLVPGKEPSGTYCLRASCRGRNAIREALENGWEGQTEEGFFPHGIEQYLLQIWPLE